MATDVQRLIKSLGGISDFDYREVAALERWQAAAARWPMLTATNRLLVERLLNGPPPRPPQKTPVHAAFTTALISLAGGTGRSTLVANVTAALGQNGRQAMAVDLDPQNGLGLHFGMDPAEVIGLVSPNLSSVGVHTWLARFRGGAAVFPFGRLDSAQLATLESVVAEDTTWVQQRLKSVVPAQTEFLLLDTPAVQGPWVKAALSFADAVIVVLQPNATAYATLPAVEALLSEHHPHGNRHARYLLNGFDARRSLDRDIFGSLRGMLGDRAFAFPVQGDSIVPEALARRKLIVQEAADSQVVAALAGLAEWLETEAAGRMEPAEQPKRAAVR